MRSEPKGTQVIVHRRQFLTWSGLSLLAAPRAWALGDDTRVSISLLEHGGGESLRPSSIEQLMWEASKRTSMDVRERPVVVDPLTETLFRSPLLVWLGEGDVPPLSESAIQRLRRYLRGGGMLYIDDCSAIGDDAFDGRVRAEVRRLWPDRPLTALGNDHTLYRTFFLLEYPRGRLIRQKHLEGVQFDDRSPLIYGRNDLFGAFSRDELGTWTMPVVPGGQIQREMAFRLGINLLMYATCLNYKRDQVHTTAILRRRRWRVETPRDTR